MKLKFLISATLVILSTLAFGQNTFNYEVSLRPISINELEGLHSYAFAQHNNKWLIIGGRTDGMHARQPNSSFPTSSNNTNMYVVDVQAKKFWSTPLSSLPTGIKEQLQSTNMNFYQDKDTLHIIGGYAYSAVANDHITFPNLTTIQVSSVIDAIINGNSIVPYFKQITDDVFAVTGGQMGKIHDKFYLVGGQRFDGRYNPMGHATYTQTYTDAIRNFTIDNSSSQLSYANYSEKTDAVHLHRRDFNLLPQIFPDGTFGYTISSGVFQTTADLPFLYPVDINENGYTPQTGFNQYLSNYHSAKASLYDSASNEMHSLFFGGMSQYYYDGTTLIKDDLVPFVKTISLLTRGADGILNEFQLDLEMPDLKGAGAEFIVNEDFSKNFKDIIDLNNNLDSFVIGHIYGGIHSPSLNPFSNNQSSTTSADHVIYEVKLIQKQNISMAEIEGQNPYALLLYPSPTISSIRMQYTSAKNAIVDYFISNAAGQIVLSGNTISRSTSNEIQLNLDGLRPQLYFVTLIIDGVYYLNDKFFKE